MEKEFDKESLKEFCDILCEISDKNKVFEALSEILTEKECMDVALRWKLMKAIFMGEPQRKIAKDYRISLCKITRGSKILKQDKSCMKDILEKYYSKERE